MRNPSPSRTSRAEVVVWRPRPKREQLAQPVDAAPCFGVQDQGRHVDRAVDRRDPLRGLLAGQVGFGEEKERRDLVLQRERDQPVDHREVQRRVDQRGDDRDRVDVGRHLLGAPAAGPPDQHEAPRMNAVDHDPVLGDHLRPD
jgi:hypothetical protein